MKNLYEMSEFWQLKLIFGSVLMLISPIKSNLLVLFILIGINILTSLFYMIKTKRYNKVRVMKDISKISTYFITILVTRLVETGLDIFMTTTIITKTAVGYLIIAEGINIMDQLSLLGVPIPAGFLKKMLSKLPIDIINKLFPKSNLQNYIDEINDIITYQIPVINSKSMQKLLTIKLNGWIQIIRNIDVLFSDNQTITNNDLIYHRIENIISIERALIHEKWIDANIPDECIHSFNKWHKIREDDWNIYVQKICYSNEDIKVKKKLIVEKMLTLLYQTVLDVLKGEIRLSKCK